VCTYVRGCIQKFLDWPPRARTTATRCSCIVILCVSIVSFAAIILCCFSTSVIIVDFVIDSVRKLLDTPLYVYVCVCVCIYMSVCVCYGKKAHCTLLRCTTILAFCFHCTFQCSQHCIIALQSSHI